MKKINWKGITAETVVGVLILVVALVNAILQMFGMNTLPISDENVSEVVSGIFLVATTLYNAYKNRNLSSAAQISQEVTDAIKAGEVTVEEVKEIITTIKNRTE